MSVLLGHFSLPHDETNVTAATPHLVFKNQLPVGSGVNVETRTKPNQSLLNHNLNIRSKQPMLSTLNPFNSRCNQIGFRFLLMNWSLGHVHSFYSFSEPFKCFLTAFPLPETYRSCQVKCVTLSQTMSSQSNNAEVKWYF